MRRILIENARRKSRLKHGGGQIRVELEGLELASASPDEQVLLLDDALAKLQAQDPQKARIVVMKFFGGMTTGEIAELLGVTERTVERQWAFAKAWLLREIRRAAGA
jgi:RNA polymerase sigma factor (TIGR02999 family)